MRKGTCIHFTGLSFHGKNIKANCCKAGVNYHEAFDHNKPGIMLRMPCHAYHEMPAHGRGTHIKPGEATIIKQIDRRGETMIPCPHFLEPTDEQVRIDREEDEASFQRAFTAIKVASEWRIKPKPAQDRREVVECPICKGRLHLSQSSYNGHVHGRCETAGCVQWME